MFFHNWSHFRFQNKIFCEETSETGETSDDTSEGISDSGLP